jgi:hypothetical protein
MERNPRRCEDGGWLRSLVGARRGIDRSSSSSIDAAFLCLATRVTRTASSVYTMMLHLAQATPTEFAGGPSCGVHAGRRTHANPRGTCTQ